MNAETPATIDRGKAYGDGLFETIAIRNGEARFLEAHLSRLQSGCNRLGIDCPQEAELTAKLRTEIANSELDLSFATARLVTAAGRSPRGYRRAIHNKAETSVELFVSTPLPRRFVSDGVAVRTCDIRLAVQPALAGIKTLNRLEQVLARAEWTDPKLFEGLTRDTADRLICGTMSNVFVVINSRVCTPALNRCGVAGVMRAQVLQLLKDDGVNVDVCDIDGRELVDAAEMFLTNSQFGVMPIRLLDDIPLKMGPITRRAQQLAAATGVPECSP